MTRYIDYIRKYEFTLIIWYNDTSET